MEIGGIARCLRTPAWADAVDALLRVCRELWPHAVFREADDSIDYDLRGWQVWQLPAASHEFFVCRDQAASKSWDIDGPTDANKNTMIHFIAEQHPQGQVRRISVVYDEESGEMIQMLAAFEAVIQDLWGAAEILDREAA